MSIQRLIKIMTASTLLLTVWLMSSTLVLAGADLNPAATTRHCETPPLCARLIQAGNSTWSYYESERQGPTVILIHGFSSSKQVWFEPGKALSSRFHVIIPDLPGWGASTDNDHSNYDIEAQATRLHDFILALEAENITLIGHSMGGAIAGVYAADQPQRVSRLVLVGALGLSFKDNDFMRELNAGGNPFIYDDRAGVERTARLVYLNPPQMSDRQVQEAILANRAQRAFIESTLAQIRPSSQWLALDHRLTKLNMPVLGIWCREDKVIDVSALDTLRNGLPASSANNSVILEGCNHLPMVERPAETLQALDAFIATSD
ncbi:abhydrolase domain-containing protein 6 [Pseudomonas jessenii]|uniref:alpha/beta fold hydrolase n=1 Tax=Pseudomonas TaxID=286 RepID=UPI00125406ED|nr:MULTISPECIES: alpha/beta hydrolase [Pseudomonas]VVO83151.1 2-succinyl-6-hydroxy-2, 4-cyclohexadiene-1-carboxylate synthase [Pseudomonas fluorescens]